MDSHGNREQNDTTDLRKALEKHQRNHAPARCSPVARTSE
jgi:hypothetical protein